MKKIVIVTLVIVSLAACKKTENPKNEHEHEAITTLSLIFKLNNTVVDTFVFDDPDGDGGNAPIRIDTIKLMANNTYTAEVLFTNKTKNPPSHVTGTIRNQANAHEVYYLTDSPIQIIKTDKDNSGFPLGLQSTWITTNSFIGTVRIKLMHKPLIKGNNDGPNVGHSDIDLIMPLQVL
jgi:hypothetical protein